MDGFGDFADTWTARQPTPGSTGMPGDVTGDGQVDDDDIDEQCTALRLGSNNPLYDLNHDGTVDDQDTDYLIGTLLQTSLGDANLNGMFNSSDLVQVLAAGLYEDAIPQNAGWSSGDWNCDGDFTTSDLVAALAAGGYVSAAEPVAAPASGLLAAAVDAVWRSTSPARATSPTFAIPVVL
jgi:hypothetical protein